MEVFYLEEKKINHRTEKGGAEGGRDNIHSEMKKT